jgi:PPOX class probable F420-dependent enzyme
MLDSRIVALATSTNHAVLTTLLPSGQPMSQVMWVDATDEILLINSEAHRRKVLNVERDQRVAVTVMDADNPHCYAEVRGVVRAIVRGERARSHADELSMRYHGAPYSRTIQSERVILEIEPLRQRFFDAPWQPGEREHRGGSGT